VTSQPQAGALIEFGPFRFDKSLGKLSKYGTSVRLRGMPLKILQHLVERPGELVSRGELQTLLWKGVAFGDFEQGLNTAVNVVRKTLGDSAANARYIETVPGQGYRFIAPIRSDLPITSTVAGLDPLPVDANGEGRRQNREAPEPGVKRSPKSRWFVAAGLAGAVLVVAAVALSAWSYLRYARARHVRTDSLPRIRTLIANDQRVAAYELTTAALRNAPDDEDLQQLSQEILTRVNLTTTPPGARISYRNYGDAGAPWREIGVTPIKNAQVPIAFLHFRAERQGLPPVELATMSPALGGVNISLVSKPEGMVLVPVQAKWDGAELESQPDFLLDRFEVTNAKFKDFVDAGGYRDPKYWRQPFRQNGSELSFDRAMANFLDATGRSAPASWQLGVYLNGQGEFPVSGVSWFEAAAYCESVGKALPTVPHWRRAAGFGLHTTILLHSNFAGAGPAPVGLNTGISPFGAYDMAGNVKEWVWNEAGERRYVLGGSWNEPSYMFHDPDAQNPFVRDSHIGFRCAQYIHPPPPQTLAPIPHSEPYHVGRLPVDDKTFEIYRRIYAYDKTPLEAKTEYRDDKNEHWIKEKVTYRTLYGQRMAAYLYLPKHVNPPYQAVMWAPGGYASFLPSSEGALPREEFAYLVRTGRAVLYPVYKGTYERRPAEHGPNVARETNVQFVKDIFQSLTFLESRGEIDKHRVAYKGYSLGAWIGVMALALEPRFKTGVLICGGLLSKPWDGELEQLNFAPRVHMPILMVGGRDDFVRPPEISQRPLFELLGTPASDKQLALFEGGHIPPMPGMMRETLQWLDKYLGSVGKQ
jgi:DNA-binding winged helix-turn-helix (wHTH) protein/dienelactone hydrolase